MASDWPVVPSEPLEGVYVAAKRKLPGPGQALNLHEAVTPEQALLASTLRAAEMAGLQDTIGSIRYTTVGREPASGPGPMDLMQAFTWSASTRTPGRAVSMQCAINFTWGLHR